MAMPVSLGVAFERLRFASDVEGLQRCDLLAGIAIAVAKVSACVGISRATTLEHRQTFTTDYHGCVVATMPHGHIANSDSPVKALAVVPAASHRLPRTSSLAWSTGNSI